MLGSGGGSWFMISGGYCGCGSGGGGGTTLSSLLLLLLLMKAMFDSDKNGFGYIYRGYCGSFEIRGNIE